MRKEVPKLSLLIVFLINFISFVSAQFYGDYGRSSFTSFLDRLDPQMVLFVIVFGIFFVVLHLWIIGKFFRGQNTLSAVISLLLAFGFTYGIYQLEFFSINDLFFNIGISNDALWPIFSVILALVLVVLFWKIRSKSFFILGLLFIGLSFTDVFYENEVTLAIGFLLVLIGTIFNWFGRRKRKGEKKEIGWNGITMLAGAIIIFVGILGGISIPIISMGIILVIIGLFFYKKTKEKARKYGGKAWKYATTRDRMREENQKAWIKNRFRRFRR